MSLYAADINALAQPGVATPVAADAGAKRKRGPNKKTLERQEEKRAQEEAAQKQAAQKEEAARLEDEKRKKHEESLRRRSEAAARRRAEKNAQRERDKEAGVSFVTGTTKPERPADGQKHVSATKTPDTPLVNIPKAKLPKVNDAELETRIKNASPETVRTQISEPPTESEKRGLQPMNPDGTAAPGKPKKARYDEDAPPSWLPHLIRGILESKADAGGEKMSKRKIEEESRKQAEERWSDPERRSKDKAMADEAVGKLYKSIFKR